MVKIKERGERSTDKLRTTLSSMEAKPQNHEHCRKITRCRRKSQTFRGKEQKHLERIVKK